MSSRPSDPRESITPESFSIAPDLIGMPLARPFRRLVAILLDLVPVGIMAAAGLHTLIAGAAAVLVWRASGSVIRARTIGVFVRAVAALVAFAWVAQLGGDGDRYRPDRDTEEAQAGMAARVLEFVPEQYRSPELDSAIAELTGEVPADTATTLSAAEADSIIVTYAAAIQGGDSTAAERLRSAAERAIAGPRIDQLRAERETLRDGVRQLREENSRLEEEVADQKESRGIRGIIAGLADDLGIGFGWGALYFTAFLVLGNGQTPGKRVMGIRVIRLDGKPIGWWYAFERFGSYFASFTTGLVGFAQILWDRNRQALHDKVVETVVVRVRHAPPLHVRTR